jgi:phage protein D
VGDTSVVITVGGQPLSDSDRQLIRRVDVSEAMYAQTQVAIVVACDVDNTSNWSTPLDSLVVPFAPFQVSLTLGTDSLVVPARATSASWSMQAGQESTLTIAGLDASADLDQEEHDQSWGGASDADIASKLLGSVATPQVGTTPPPSGADSFTPHQRGTDWSFLTALALRNDFDVYLTSQNGTLFGVFDRIDPTAAAQTTLDLGYGSLGGSADVQVQLVSGQRVRYAYGSPGQGDQQIAENDGTGNAMGTQSLGGATTVLRDAHDLPGTQSPDVAARVLAERSAFGATLSVTLNAASMPLLHARSTVTVRGLGSLVSGLWLVKSVRHTVTDGGHIQAVTLARNALGDGAAAASSLAGAL